MNILVVGALSWNPERVISLCERGHKLFGLWTRTMAWEQGPYRFAEGFIRDVTPDNYVEVIKKENIEIIYSLFQTYQPSSWSDDANNSLADIWKTLRRIFSDRAKGLFDIPIVRHWGFDICYLDRGVAEAFDGHIFCNRGKYIYFTAPEDEGGLGLNLPLAPERFAFMDGDLPKWEFGNNNFSGKLSEIDGQIHTVCAGRPIGIDHCELTRQKIHIHIYGNNFDDIINMMASGIPTRKMCRVDFSYVHLHPSLQAINKDLAETRAIKNRWVPEFSRYDAGWSYVNARWRPLLNDKAVIPNRLSTCVIAGLPIIAETLPGYYRYDILKENNIQVDFSRDDYDGLAKKLRDREMMKRKAGNVLACRKKFSFDYYIDGLIHYFDSVRRIYYAQPRSFNFSQTAFEKTAIGREFRKKKSVLKKLYRLAGRMEHWLKAAYLKKILRKHGDKKGI